MRLSFWTLGTPGWSNQQVVEAAKRFGYGGVDLRCNSGGNLTLQSTDKEVDALVRLFNEHGIEIASMLAYNQRGSEEGVDWDGVAADLIANARMAVRLGTAAMRVNAGCPARNSDWDAYLDGLAAAVKQALAEVPEILLRVQNHPGSITAAQAGRLAELVADPRFGLGFSPDHCVDMGEDPVALARAVAPWVRQVHVADRVRLTDGKLKACLPGEGLVPNLEVLAELKQRGFDGWVSFKWEKSTYPDLPDAEIALPHAAAFLAGKGD